MQASESGSEPVTPVALRTAAAVQAPVVQPVPASQQVQFLRLTEERPTDFDPPVGPEKQNKDPTGLGGGTGSLGHYKAMILSSFPGF